MHDTEVNVFQLVGGIFMPVLKFLCIPHEKWNQGVKGSGTCQENNFIPLDVESKHIIIMSDFVIHFLYSEQCSRTIL